MKRTAAMLALMMAASCSDAGDSGGAQISPSSPTTVAAAAPCSGPDSADRRYITTISPDGRYFEDQYGDPVLVRGDSPWSGLVDWSPEQAELYFADRAARGFNASIISAIGAPGNGGPSDQGATFDGIEPFVDGDITAWNEPYWARLDEYFRIACRHGNTLFLYPVDGWNLSDVFASATPQQAFVYGRMFAQRYARFPNLVWLTGGDYSPDTEDRAAGAASDHVLRAMLDGIRAAGSDRPFSIQLGAERSLSTDNPFWEPLVDWNFVYMYMPTYKAVLDGYARAAGARDPRPALFSEGNYEGENNQSDTAPTTDGTLRRQALWALTSGSPGEFRGSDDWEFRDGWETRLDTPAVTQLEAIRELWNSWPWWQLVPDVDEPLVVDGRGAASTDEEMVDVLDNDYVTAARTPDRSLAVVYVPTRRTIRLDPSLVPSGATAVWIDPADAGGPTQPADLKPDGTVPTPGANRDGNEDWLLAITT
ncbi:DUF4038 domain-containing protein [Rhodococcus ruber]|uniref:Apiosidase-like catalytic domain-containing protein n=1 Tax=Rhodococcus ruber TaxID=1830 RepID=A0A098BPN8_9NOCA|nr:MULTISPECIES: DUF4038 domain-containing protein [Rhodococcus]AUM19228.1 DUF4038 domain-containing protein [Rhodococcus ruber]MBD8057238.1 DUF4038 domain-containing protein [Rhodococcus ruber]MCD2130075.1 DUF4038 domain-containing protein [Rhodococcus ruber]MCF8784666.1 DUF4038 domain-containing protein [Rhodococcus ruber]MCZ1075651.1 DUF4038 domain-containing protein [Rhodococcus sp. A5(2022)]